MRSRNIKPNLFKNDELAELDPLARLLFIGLWCYADREGRIKYRPARIKAELLPYDDCDIEELMTQLDSKDFIRLYEVEKQAYLWIPKFLDHQRPHPNEKESELPPYTSGSNTKVVSPSHQGVVDDISDPSDSLFLDSCSLIPDTLIPDIKNKTPTETKNSSGSEPYDLYAGFIEIKQPDEVTPKYKSRNIGIASNLLKSGYSESDVLACAKYMQSEHWRTGTWDLKAVTAKIDEWIAEGRPEYERVRGSPNGKPKPGDGLREFNRLMDEMESGYEPSNVHEIYGSDGISLADTARRDER